jgi:hypothetical protein
MSPLAGRLALAALLLVPSHSLAGSINVSCSSPMVFSGADVNVVVLPYSVPPELGPASREIGNELATLVQQELLLAIARFGGVGAVQLRSDEGKDCTVEGVTSRLLGAVGGATDIVKPGRGLVLVWGRVFRERDTLLLQSFVQFMRRGVDEAVDLRIGGQPFSARLSSQAFACLPRRIAMSDMESIRAQFARTRVIHQAPNEQSDGYPIPRDDPFPYWVQAAEGNWLRIQSKAGGPSGWILARVDRAEWSLRTRLPELSFIEGITGYLRYRVALAEGRKPNVGLLDAAAAAVTAYQREWRAGAFVVETGSASASRAGGQPLAIGVPAQLMAFTALARPEPTPVEIQAAIGQVDRALALLPHSADVRNLAAILRLKAAYSPSPGGDAVASLVGELQAALGAEPANVTALANLKSLCRLLLGAAEALPPSFPPLTAEERGALQRQLEALQSVGG